jgi:hypothetical protein
LQEILFLGLLIMVGNRKELGHFPFNHTKGERSMSSNKPELTFKYVFNYGYNPSYVNGAQGGFSPRGEMVINFYLERQPLPDAITHEITPEGAIGRETGVDPKDLASSMVRFIDTGVVMSYENAKVFHAWMGDKLREVEEMHKARTAFEQSQVGGQA